MNTLTMSPVFGVSLTVMFYAAALLLQKKLSWAHPLIVTCAGLMLTIKLLRIPLENYAIGGDMLTYLLGPAVIALGVPVYKNGRNLSKAAVPLSVAIGVGSTVGMLTAGVCAAWMGAPKELIASAVPKSVTTPIAMEIARELHGFPEIAAAMALMAGIIGNLVGPEILRFCGVKQHLAMGAAMGTSSHGFGAARMLKEHDLQGSTASLAMAVAGITVSVLAMLVPWILRIMAGRSWHGI
jgi:predicted murein hydrolase (TIGR00659 family)